MRPSTSSASTDPTGFDGVFRRPTEADHPRVLAAVEQWWGGRGGAEGARYRAALLPRLFFQHFTDTSTVVEHPDGRLAGSSPVNTPSIAFHTALGFTFGPAVPDYDGSNHDRVCFTLVLPDATP